MGIIRIPLVPWTELHCIFEEIIPDDFDLIVKIHLPISNKKAIITLPKNSEEGKILSKKLNDKMIGRKIALLSTDIKNKELLIRELSK